MSTIASRWWRPALAFLWPVVLLVAFGRATPDTDAQGFMPNTIIRARSLELVDSQGRVRIVMDVRRNAPSLRFLDAEGEQQIGLRATSGDSSTFALGGGGDAGTRILLSASVSTRPSGGDSYGTISLSEYPERPDEEAGVSIVSNASGSLLELRGEAAANVQISASKDGAKAEYTQPIPSTKRSPAAPKKVRR